MVPHPLKTPVIPKLNTQLSPFQRHWKLCLVGVFILCASFGLLAYQQQQNLRRHKEAQREILNVSRDLLSLVTTFKVYELGTPQFFYQHKDQQLALESRQQSFREYQEKYQKLLTALEATKNSGNEKQEHLVSEQLKKVDEIFTLYQAGLNYNADYLAAVKELNEFRDEAIAHPSEYASLPHSLTMNSVRAHRDQILEFSDKMIGLLNQTTMNLEELQPPAHLAPELALYKENLHHSQELLATIRQSVSIGNAPPAQVFQEYTTKILRTSNRLRELSKQYPYDSPVLKGIKEFEERAGTVEQELKNLSDQ